MAAPPDEDRQLLSRCIAGESEAKELFVRRFSDLVYRMVQHTFSAKDISFTKPDLEDLHNSVFLRLFENKCKRLRQYKGKNGCSISSWIRIIAVRTVIDHLRKQRVDALNRAKTFDILEHIDLFSSEEPEPWVNMDRQERWNKIIDGMKVLLPRDRLFLKLHCMEGIPIGQIAELMRISKDNAYSLKHRAIKRLNAEVLTRSV